MGDEVQERHWIWQSLPYRILMRDRALDAIMAHYAEGSFTYPKATVQGMAVIRLKIESMTGKTFGY